MGDLIVGDPQSLEGVGKSYGHTSDRLAVIVSEVRSFPCIDVPELVQAELFLTDVSTRLNRARESISQLGVDLKRRAILLELAGRWTKRAVDDPSPISNKELQQFREERIRALVRPYMGSGSYEGRCEVFVELLMGLGQKDSAFARWQHAKKQGIAHPADKSPPAGALVFWSWVDVDGRFGSPGENLGHVAISLGNGRALGTSAEGEVVGEYSLDNFEDYLGWTAAVD